MARHKLGGDSEAVQAKPKGKPNPYVGGLWVKESGEKQLLSYIVKSMDDKLKLLAHLQESIDAGDSKSFILTGIENSYKKGNTKAPHYVFLIPSPKPE